MNRPTFFPAFTLVELLISVAIFTGILGTFFSTAASIKRAESFRDNSQGLTQAASYGFEPISRSIEDAGGLELLTYGGTSYCVRGFYVRDSDPKTVASGSVRLTTLLLGRVRDNAGTVVRQMVRRDYFVDSGRLVEQTYTMPPGGDVGTQCQPIAWGAATVTSRFLTGSDVVAKLELQMVAPLLADGLDSKVVRQGAYVTYQVSVDYPIHRKGIAPMVLKTTVVPTFVYGEKRE